VCSALALVQQANFALRGTSTLTYQDLATQPRPGQDQHAGRGARRDRIHRLGPAERTPQRRLVRIDSHWEQGEDELWYLVSDRAGRSRLIFSYPVRMWMEEMYGADVPVLLVRAHPGPRD
jgi:hypothetical protein